MAKFLVTVGITAHMVANTMIEADTEEEALKLAEEKNPANMDWEYDGIGAEVIHSMSVWEQDE